MIVCTECGRHNEDSDDFCGECGAFLEFSGERTAGAEADPAIGDEEDEDAARPGLVERVKTAVLGEGAGTAGDFEAGDRTGPGETAVTAGAVGGVAEAEEDDGTAEIRRRAEEDAQRRSAEAAREAEAARLAAEQAEQEAEEERRRAEEAEERRAREAAAAAEAAERAEAQARAEAAAREAAARAAEQEAAEAREREEAEAEAAAKAEARVEAEEERRAREAAAQAAEERRVREAAARAEEERQARETAEREAAERAEAERRAREEAEAARLAAEERAKIAEKAREEAERHAQEAERAARMAALVAKPRPAEPTSAPPQVPAAGAGKPRAKAKASGRAAPKEPDAAPAEEAEPPAALTSRKPEAVKPQRQRQKRTPAPTSTAEVINPGDLVCGSCGAGNDPERRFCRRCGASLVAAAVMPKPPWYRRLFRRRPKAQVVAGTRPDAKKRKRGLKSRAQYAVSGTKSRIGKIGRILAILGVLGITGLSLGPLRSEASDLLDRAKRIISPEYEPVRPAEARATSELPGHPAMFAIDQIKNSYWAEGSEGDGVGEGLTLVFPEPTDIDRIGFLNGASETPASFVTQPRIREFQLLFDDGTTQRLTLADKADFQQFGVEARDVTTVQLQILSVYPSLEGSAASLAEVELFRKR